MQSPLLDVTDAAARLGIATKTLYKWIENSQIPHIRIGRLVRFREEDLEEWVVSKIKKPGSAEVASPTER